jgi:hypothetical protein
MPPVTLRELVVAAKAATKEGRWLDAHRSAARALMLDSGSKEANELMQTVRKQFLWKGPLSKIQSGLLNPAARPPANVTEPAPTVPDPVGALYYSVSPGDMIPSRGSAYQIR